VPRGDPTPMPKSAQVRKQLVALSIAASCGLLNPASSLLRIPRELVECAIAEADESLPAEERRRLLDLLSHDPRVSVRARLVEAVVGLWPEPRVEVQEVLRKLSRDESPDVRAAAGVALRSLVESVPPIARLELVCRWAVAEATPERVAAAVALRSHVPVLASDLVLEQLALDRDATVRQAALDAITTRLHENPELYRRLVRDLSRDDDRGVQARALSALREDVGV
jgi:HEAT repeat protein